MERVAPRRALALMMFTLTLAAVASPASAALSRDQRVCVDGLSRALDKVDRQGTRQIDSCLKRHAARKPLDPRNPSLTTLEACIGADPRGRIARAVGGTQAHFEKRCSAPPLGRLEDPFPEFGATDAARVNGAALGFAPDLAHALFGPDLDVTAAVDRDAAKCQQAAWKAATRCQQARSAAYRSCQKRALAGGGGAPAAGAREELRGACLGDGAEVQPDPGGRLAASCFDPGKGIAKALGKACGGQDLAALLPGCAGEPDAAACLDRQVACSACRELSLAGDLRRSCDLFDDGVANGTCGETALRCESPPDGAMIVAAPGTEIELAGQVPDPSQIESVTVDGVPVALDAEGFFSHPLTAEFGIHFLELAAHDETGSGASRICSFLASESFSPEDGFLGDALALSLAQTAVDDGNRGGALNSLGDVLHTVVNGAGLRNALHAELVAANPLHSECYMHNPISGACITSVNLTYTGSLNQGPINGPNLVGLDLVPGGLGLAAEARNLSISLRVTGRVLGVAYDQSGTVSADWLRAALISDVKVVGGAFRADIRPASISTEAGTISVSLAGVPQLVTNVVVGLFQGSIKELITNTIADFARTNLGSVLDDLLENLEIPATPLDVPRLAAPGSIALSLEAAPSSAAVSDARALLGLAVRSSAPAAHDLPSLGVALPSGPVLGDPGAATPLALASHLGLLNQLLHSLWRGGLLHGHLDESVLAELGPGVEAELEPLLPPVISSADGETGIVQLGALRVSLTYPGIFDEPVLLSLGAEALVTLATEGNSLLLESITLSAVHVSGVEAALTPGDQLIVDVLAGVILQRALQAALAATAEGLPSPAFAPTALEAYGIPAGSQLGLVGPALDSTPTHLQLRGSFGLVD